MKKLLISLLFMVVCTYPAGANTYYLQQQAAAAASARYVSQSSITPGMLARTRQYLEQRGDEVYGDWSADTRGMAISCPWGYILLTWELELQKCAGWSLGCKHIGYAR